MKYAIALALLLTAVAAFAVTNTAITAPNNGSPLTTQNGTRFGATDEVDVDTVAAFNFEAGNQGWTIDNLTITPSYWHKDTRSAYGGTGLSWSANDTVPTRFRRIGGYDNHTLNYLVMPTVNLTGIANPVLTFQVNVMCEDPAGATAPYTGWDAGNVWVSGDTGRTWSVLPITAAAGATGYMYNVTSAYSFGAEFGMGANIAGWGGNSSGWRLVNVPIPTTYRTSGFKVRFAFCSDPGWCSTDDSTLFGMRVDNIQVVNGATVMLNNTADTETPGAATIQNGTTSNNNWSREQENTVGHSRPYCMKILEPAVGFRSALTSPVVRFNTGARYYWQYNVWCDFRDATSTGSTSLKDYYRVEIRRAHPDCTWTYQHHDYNRTGAGGDGWTLYGPGTPFNTTGSTANVQMDLSNYAGDSCQIRIIAIGDFDNAGGTGGTGLFVDDVQFLSSNQPDFDLSTTMLNVPYPNTVGFLTRGSAKVTNLGRQAMTGATLRWRRNASMYPIALNTLNSGTDTTVVLKTGTTGQAALGWIPTAAGKFAVDAYTFATGDTSRGNDSSNFFISGLSTIDSILVRPSGTYELGYDSHRLQFAFNFASGQGPMVKFTPAADSLPQPYSWNLSGVRMQFNGLDIPTGQTRSFSLKVFNSNAGALGQMIANQTFSATRDSTLPNWYTAIFTAPVTVTGDFYVFFDRGTATDTLRIVGHDNQPVFNRSHFYLFNGTAIIDSNDAAYRIHAILQPSTAVNEPVVGSLPKKYELFEAYPNPFNPTTEVKFAVPSVGRVEIALFNTLGQQVSTLYRGVAQPGVHAVKVDGSGLTSGVYFVRMTANGFTANNKIVLVK